jgi:hypothetical protein
MKCDPKLVTKKVISLFLITYMTSALMTEIALVLYPTSNIWIQKALISQLTEKHRVFYQIVSFLAFLEPT